MKNRTKNIMEIKWEIWRNWLWMVIFLGLMMLKRLSVVCWQTLHWRFGKWNSTQFDLVQAITQPVQAITQLIQAKTQPIQAIKGQMPSLLREQNIRVDGIPDFTSNIEWVVPILLPHLCIELEETESLLVYEIVIARQLVFEILWHWTLYLFWLPTAIIHRWPLGAARDVCALRCRLDLLKDTNFISDQLLKQDKIFRNDWFLEKLVVQVIESPSLSRNWPQLLLW